jgi:transcription initiation factor TFIIIB Brf1 subunit/transcription initiation factor TFIIB
MKRCPICKSEKAERWKEGSVTMNHPKYKAQCLDCGSVWEENPWDSEGFETFEPKFVLKNALI